MEVVDSDIMAAPDELWQQVISVLPVDLDGSAFCTGALLRKRGVKSGADLLRLVLAYSMEGLSLRDTAAWAKQEDVASLSDVALLGRLKNCGDWIGLIIARYLASRSGLNVKNRQGLRLRITDATGVNRPGSTQPDWRVHLGFDMERLRIDHVELTDAKGGETLKRVPVEAGDIWMGDRGYASRNGITDVVGRGGEVLVRAGRKNLPLTHPDGRRFDLLGECEGLETGEIREFDVATVPLNTGKIRSVSGRLIVLRKNEADAEKACKRLLRRRRKKGRKITQESIDACEYVFVFTTLSRKRINAGDVLELYRFRWQIEIAFKRMKSILHLDHIAARDDSLCRTFILGNLLGAVIVEHFVHQTGAFPPCGCRTRGQSTSVASV